MAAFWLLCAVTEELLPEHFTALMLGVQAAAAPSAPTLHLPCTYPAPNVHLPCTTVHLPCTYRAPTVAYRAPTVYLPCIYRACAVHVHVHVACAVQVDNRVLDQLVAEHPELHAASASIEASGFELSLVSTQWFCKPNPNPSPDPDSDPNPNPSPNQVLHGLHQRAAL